MVLKMTVSKKLIKLDKLLKKSKELSSKLIELNNDEDENDNELSNFTINSKKTLKSDMKAINKIMKEFDETHNKISEISSTFTDEEKEELKKLDLKI